MHTLNKRRSALVSILCLALATLACGILKPAEPTPTLPPTAVPPTDTPLPSPTPPPTSTPLPTLPPTPMPPPAGSMQTYSNETMGLSIDYPSDWYADQEEGAVSTVTFATEMGFEPGDSGVGAALGIFAIPLAGSGISDVEDLWDMLATEFAEEDTAIGEPEPFPVGGKDGLAATVESPSDDVYGWLIMTIANQRTYLFVAACSPPDAWDDYEDTFSAMLDSVEFAEIAAGTGTGSFTARDDVPIPDDAEVIADLPTVLGYRTTASIEEAAEFCESAWPDYGWTAETDNMLYGVTDEGGLLVFIKDNERALVAIALDDTSEQTQVSIVIGEE